MRRNVNVNATIDTMLANIAMGHVMIVLPLAY